MPHDIPAHDEAMAYGPTYTLPIVASTATLLGRTTDACGISIGSPDENSDEYVTEVLSTIKSNLARLAALDDEDDDEDADEDDEED